MLRRALLVLLGLLLAAALAPGSVAAADPSGPATVPGGLTPAGRTLAAAAFTTGDCELTTVTCRPSNQSGSCTGYSSQTTAPTSIRVLVRDTETTYHIAVVNFLTYVQNVLPEEWPATYDGDALKAGAVAVKSYAWYWVTHYGGYTGSTASAGTCFDVTDDQDFQVYKAGSAVARTNQKIADSWPVVVRRNGQIVQTLYRAFLESRGEACGAGRNGTTMSQVGTQACNEANTAYKYNVILRLYYGNDIEIGTTAQLRTAHDFTFTARSTGAAFTAGRWTIADGYPTTFAYGQKGDVPFAATTGDGFATAAVWRPSTRVFYVANALHQLVSTVRFGNVGDIPVAARYRGLAAATQPAVFRPSTGTWYFAGPGGAIASTSRYGLNGDIPVPGRWLSTTTDVISVWRPSNGTWNVPGQKAPVSWGVRGDVPAPADYNGDGITDVAVYRPSTHAFYVRNVPRVVWGVSGDVPVTGDFDGDGKADFAVYRPSNGNLYVHNQATVVNIGKSATPIGAAPFRG